MALLLFALVLLGSLILIPFGLPGLWVMIGAAVVFMASAGEGRIGTATIIIVVVLAFVAELLEFFLSARYVRQYGGSRRGARGAIIGGMVGAILGVPFPIPFVGSVIGALAGSFVGALVGELNAGSERAGATRAATGALVGRAVAAALKIGAGCAIAVILMIAAWS